MVCPLHRCSHLLTVALTYSFRPGELLGLRWDDVNLASQDDERRGLPAHTLSITGSLERERGLLRRGVTQRPTVFGPVSIAGHDLVFANEVGGAIDPSTFDEQ